MGVPEIDALKLTGQPFLLMVLIHTLYVYLYKCLFPVLSSFHNFHLRLGLKPLENTMDPLTAIGLAIALSTLLNSLAR